jgi:hypothetical protein
MSKFNKSCTVTHTPLKQYRTLNIFETRITAEEGQLTCLFSLFMLLLDMRYIKLGIFSLLFSNVFILAACGLFPQVDRPPVKDDVGYISFTLNTEKITEYIEEFNPTRAYVLNGDGEQIGPGTPYAETMTLSIPAEFNEPEMEVCVGGLYLSYASKKVEKVEIEAGETICFDLEDIGIGIPGGALPEIPGITSAGNVKVDFALGGEPYSIESVEISSVGNDTPFLRGKQQENDRMWKLIMPEPLEGKKFRFWVTFGNDDTTYYFYEDKTWNSEAGVSLKVTYKSLTKEDC